MEYNHKLVEALSKISISPLLIGDPNSLRILLEDKLDEAHHHTLDINPDKMGGHTEEEDK